MIEAWLQAKVDNANRGRTMGTYRMVDTRRQPCGAVDDRGARAGLLRLLQPAGDPVLRGAVAADADAPDPARRPAPRRACAPALAGRCRRLAVAGVIVSGVSGASFRMVGPLYGAQVGAQRGPDRLFPRGPTSWAGRWRQWPAGWAADRNDRRVVMVWFSLGSIAACGITGGAVGAGGWSRSSSPRCCSGRRPFRSIRFRRPMPMTGPRTASAWSFRRR